MKQMNTRTLAWGALTIGVLSTAAFSDSLTFANSDDKKNVGVEAEAKEEALRLLLTDDKDKYRIFTAGAGKLAFTEADKKETNSEEPAEAVTLEAVVAPVVTAAQQLEEPTQEAVVVSAWDTKAMANVEDQANVRVQPSQESDLAGRIRRGDEADVLERGAEWTLIASGNVTGYVKNEFLLFGAEAEALAGQLSKKLATVQAEGVNVRTQPSVDAGIHEQAETGDVYTYTADENGWITVKLDSGETGYISAQFVTTQQQLGKAITMQEEQAILEAEQEAARKAAQERAEKEAKERAKKEQAEAQKQAKKSQSSSSQSVSTHASVDDVTLLAAIIEIEAGTNYEGGVAVGNVVLNRVHSSRFPNSISGVIYQSGQFPGAHNGKLARVLSRGPKSTCIAAAQAALNGDNIVGGRLYFNSQRSVNYSRISNYVIVGGNCFY